MERCLARISEAAVKLGEIASELAPEIPWRDIRGMGNQLRHAYDGISPEILWNAMKYDLPPLKRACERALKELESRS